MNEEIDETEFYHQDFTTASEWEIFIAHMEEIINQWKVDEINDKGKQPGIWKILTESLNFADTEFELLYFKLNEQNEEKNIIDLNYDFILSEKENEHPHFCLYKWYGLKEYIVLTPTNNAGICNESKIKVLQSSLYIAANNLNHSTPMFVQIREKWQQLYLGVYENGELRTNFEMIHLQKGPQHCQYLTGLLSLFTSKIMSPVTLDTINSSIQFRYNLTDFGKHLWSKNIFSSDSFDLSSLNSLPLGVTTDPINLIQLKCTWFNLPDFVVNDSSNFTDFEAKNAHQWSIVIKTTNQPVLLLEDCLMEYMQLSGNNSTVSEILGEFNPLDLLSERMADIPSLLTRTARNSLSNIGNRDTKPIRDDVLVHLLYYLFPDAEPIPSYPYNLSSQGSPSKVKNGSEPKTFENECRGFKTCPIDSLLWRFAIVSAHALHSLGGLRAFAYIWYEFCQEMRYRWEKSIIVPGLLREFPDLRTGLLNQKLQMLNCCIARKRERDAAHPDFDSAENSSDDEFYDCDEEPRRRATGRLVKFDALKLRASGDDVYVPITQDPGPKTEDQLEEDADFLMKLGADAVGSELRAKIMSASLLSDMEAFKAANPGAVLEDFVRWYSPRDWEETDELDRWGQKKGKLSTRMLIEGNIWAEKWASAKPIPAIKQKLLFVHTREAEKVLHFLETRTLSQIFALIVPTLLQCAIYRLRGEIDKDDADEIFNIDRVVDAAKRLSRDDAAHARRVDAIVQEMAPAELLLSKIESLQVKFAAATAPARDLARGKEVVIDKEGQLADRLVALFADQERELNMVTERVEEAAPTSNFPTAAAEREFVMRTPAVRPARFSARGPQFMRAVLSKHEFRLAGAFSEDVCFF